MRKFLLLALLLPVVSLAQTAKDTSHVKIQKSRIDSVRTDIGGVSPHLTDLRRYCKNNSATKYICDDTNAIKQVLADTSRLLRASSFEDSLLVGVTPPPTPVVTTITVTPSSTSLSVGDSVKEVATAKDQFGNPIAVSLIWSSTSSSTASVSNSGVVKGLAAGSSTITASSGSVSGTSSVNVVSPVPPDPTQPALPTLLTSSVASTPSNGRTLRVGSSFQAALDSARSGDRVLLHAGTDYTGTFIIRRTGCANGWLTISTDSTLPPEGVLMTDSLKKVYRLPRLLPDYVNPPLSFAAEASCVRVMGIEVTTPPTIKVSNTLVEVGDGGATSVSQLPRNIVLDRMFIHGTDSLDVHRCVALNSDSTSIVDSWVSDCHSRGIDAQAIWGWNGRGPYKIVNNHLEASSEVFGFGGADPAIQGLVPSDIEFRRNYLTRPMSWKGGPWLIKNLIEFKNARRALIDGNVLENSWPQGQLGWAFVLWSVNQQGSCTWCVTSDVTITNNLIRNVAAGFQLNEQYGPAIPMQRIAIRNNIMIGVDNPAVNGGGYGFLVQGFIPSLSIEHNTFFVPTISEFQWSSSKTLLTNHIIRNNLTGGGTYSLFASPTNSWNAFVDTATSMFQGNVVALGGYYSSGYPSGNWYPPSLDSLKLVGGGSAAFAVTSPPGSLALAPTSPYKAAGTDGKDPGADVSAVITATNGVAPALSLTRMTASVRPSTPPPVPKPDPWGIKAPRKSIKVRKPD